MVCHGPDPPDNSPQELTPPPMSDLMMNGPQAEDSDDDGNDYDGYQPLPQGPEGVVYHAHSEDEDEDATNGQPQSDTVPPIEPMDRVLTRDVWTAPRLTDSIQMDNERAQQVMSAMANFVLPPTSIPQWAQCVAEDQWKQTLHERIQSLNDKET